MEIKSALWQKIFVFPLGLVFCGGGIVCAISPYFASLSATANGPIKAPIPIDFVISAILGVLLIVAGFALWWTVAKYSIRADDQGIEQSNGFRSQAVKWDAVDAYYYSNHPREVREQKRFREPIMVGTDGTVRFKKLGHLLVFGSKELAQQKKFWEYCEARLVGKKVEAPEPDFKPTEIAIQSLDFDPKQKSPRWMAGRIFLLLFYGAIWSAFLFVPAAYYSLHPEVRPANDFPIFLLLGLFGPLIPHLIWIQWKAWKIRRDSRDAVL
ncbi:hypothetical protein EON80_15135 [bacterium]|nr:MAG: hypothetical protein EON80_15135 [bacterium]